MRLDSSCFNIHSDANFQISKRLNTCCDLTFGWRSWPTRAGLCPTSRTGPMKESLQSSRPQPLGFAMLTLWYALIRTIKFLKLKHLRTNLAEKDRESRIWLNLRRCIQPRKTRGEKASGWIVLYQHSSVQFPWQRQARSPHSARRVFADVWWSSCNELSAKNKLCYLCFSLSWCRGAGHGDILDSTSDESELRKTRRN